MNGYIKKTDAISAVLDRRVFMSMCASTEDCDRINFGLKLAVKALMDMPENEGEPENTGSWIRIDDGDVYHYECSECASELPRNTYGSDWFSAYCPACGARLSGPGTEDEVEDGEVS